MKCEKTGMYTILMDEKQWCSGCQDYHEPKLSNEDDEVAGEQSRTPGSFPTEIRLNHSQHCE